MRDRIAREPPTLDERREALSLTTNSSSVASDTLAGSEIAAMRRWRGVLA